MQIGLKLWSTNYNNYSNEALRLYELGYFNYLELYVVPGTLDFAKKWKNLNLPFTLHCPHSVHNFNLAKPELKESNLKIFDEVRKYADELDVDYIVIHGGTDGKVEEASRQLKALNEPRAVIENKPYLGIPEIAFNKTCIGYNPEQIELIKNESGCGFCLDFCHAICAANSFGYNYIDFLKDFMKLKPDMFHISDMPDEKSEYDGHFHLGQGNVNLKSLAQFIKTDSKISLETAKNSKTSLEDFIEDYKFVNNLIG